MNQPSILFLLSDEHSFRCMKQHPQDQEGEPVHTTRSCWSSTRCRSLFPKTRNCYLMPSGRLVDADAVLYHPCVLSENAAEAFADYPSRAPEKVQE